MDKLPASRLRAAFAFALALPLFLGACATRAPATSPPDLPMRVTEHRGADDLLTAGLGLAGLRSPTPPAFSEATSPTPAELRRRALWSNWRGIADLSPAGGYGSLYGSSAQVPGREFQSLRTVPGARHPHRVLAQVPDGFDAKARCLVVGASSGSRGVYGAIAVAGAWGLPRGCAVAYTDKGAGSDYFDLDAGQGVAVDGTLAAPGTTLAFAPDVPVTAGAVAGVAFKHAHSQDNPEADWGRHVKQAAEFGLQALDAAFPEQAPFRFDNTRVIAVGISNGGGAVLRAGELEGDWLDAVVAGEPSVLSDSPGARALYDYTTEAALLMPCALRHLGLPVPPTAPGCDALAAAGLVEGADEASRARDAHARLKAAGWSDAALGAGSISVGFDLWRAVAAAYASAYGRYAAGEHPCGYKYAALDTNHAPRAATAAERAAWWSDGSGIPPGAGIGLVDAAPERLAGLRCLRALWTDGGAAAARVQAGVEATRAQPAGLHVPTLVVHGRDDGLIPPAFTSAPYVAAARAAGARPVYWEVPNAQHFDAFLGLPAYGARYVPLLPYVYLALDAAWAHVAQAQPLPADRVFDTVPRGAAELDAAHLGLR